MAAGVTIASPDQHMRVRNRQLARARGPGRMDVPAVPPAVLYRRWQAVGRQPRAVAEPQWWRELQAGLQGAREAGGPAGGEPGGGGVEEEERGGPSRGGRGGNG